MTAASLTWLGHASFRLDSPGGKRIYVDPWFDNPKCPASEKDPDRCDVIAVTHGHSGELLGTKRVVPCHYGTFPLLAGTPDELKQLANGVDVHTIDPGESIEL